ncbi:hypothetical protein K438DRAFT_1749794 [Mycena galopus ATCC 62051]|nr:hypothetical protein K438DRAFT_1749794 [Mycena galopus ATCC 62051]
MEDFNSVGDKTGNSGVGSANTSQRYEAELDAEIPAGTYSEFAEIADRSDERDFTAGQSDKQESKAANNIPGSELPITTLPLPFDKCTEILAGPTASTDKLTPKGCLDSERTLYTIATSAPCGEAKHPHTDPHAPTSKPTFAAFWLRFNWCTVHRGNAVTKQGNEGGEARDSLSAPSKPHLEPCGSPHSGSASVPLFEDHQHLVFYASHSFSFKQNGREFSKQALFFWMSHPSSSVGGLFKLNLVKIEIEAEPRKFTEYLEIMPDLISKVKD